MSDQAAADANRMRTERASDEAAAQNIERRQGITQRAGVQIDRKRVEYTPETQVGDLTIARGRQVTEREEMGAGAGRGDAGAAAREQGFASRLMRRQRQDAKPSDGNQTQAAGTPTPLGMVEALPGVGTGPTGAEDKKAGTMLEEGQQQVGRGCLMSLWSSLWLTFGHTIYLICLMFFLASKSTYARKFIPEVGEEWFPGPMLKKIPKVLLLPIKLGEMVGIMFILLFVFMLDIACIGIIAVLLGILMSAASVIS